MNSFAKYFGWFLFAKKKAAPIKLFINSPIDGSTINVSGLISNLPIFNSSSITNNDKYITSTILNTSVNISSTVSSNQIINLTSEITQ